MKPFTAFKSHRVFKRAKKKAQRLTSKAKRTLGLSDSALDPIWQVHFRKVFRFSDWAQKTLADTPIDVCIVHDALALEAARVISKRSGCPLIYDAVEYPDYGGRTAATSAFNLDRRGLGLILSHEREVVRQVSSLIVGTRGVADWYGADEVFPKASIVRNCLDFQDMPADRRIREDCGLHDGDKLILYANSVHPHCGVDWVIAALSKLAPNVHLAIMGDISPMMRAELDCIIRSSEVGCRVHILPLRTPEDLLEYRSGADIAVIPLDPQIPNHRTCLPNRVFECVMSRLPLVISDLPYIREVVEEFDCGKAFESNRPSVVAEALEEVLDNLAEYKFRVEHAAQVLSWGNERNTFVSAISPTLGERTNLNIVCVANKRLTTNRRVFRHIRTLAELGHNVTLMSLYAPVDFLKVPRVRYHAMIDDDVFADSLEGS